MNKTEQVNFYSNACKTCNNRMPNIIHIYNIMLKIFHLSVACSLK